MLISADGAHIEAAALLRRRGESVIGLDNMDPYYDVALKEARLARLQSQAGFKFVRANICDKEALKRQCQTN